MDVKDGLSRGGTIVKDHPEAINKVEFGGQLCAYPHHLTDKLLIFRLHERRSNNMFFGDDQKMDRRLGRDIPEGQELIVFVEFLRRDFTGNDLTEQAMFIHSFSLMISA